VDGGQRSAVHRLRDGEHDRREPLLIGVGWAAVVFTYWFKTRRQSFSLEPAHKIEIFYLGLATLYLLHDPAEAPSRLARRGRAGDDLYLLHPRRVARGARRARARRAAAYDRRLGRRAAARDDDRALFTLRLYHLHRGGAVAESLLATGQRFGVEEFLLVQWLAPLASESPEFIVAILFALKANPGASLGTLLSSKVNQWTLLIGMLPLVYMFSRGEVGPMEMDARQSEEIFLTAAQSLFAVAVLANLSFSLKEAALLFGLFATQLFIPDPRLRTIFSFVYIALTIGYFVFQRETRRSLSRPSAARREVGAQLRSRLSSS
jgi:cation:H+ antiporter